MVTRHAFVAAFLAVASLSGPAVGAETRRVGLFVGSNAAAEGREPLRFAETDAARMRSVFVELGSMAPEDAVLLEGANAEQILGALDRLGDRAKGAVFVFYYSGHADDRALLLGESELSFARLVRALEDTGAQLGLHLVDACRSGALTRRKGAHLGARLSLRSEPTGTGRVVITSSAEWEDAQESDRLGGSFFTLHLATALRGAADLDNDARVTLEEAYRYVYGRTVESTVGTPAGPQHPTYAYDLSGRGEVILTWPKRAGGTLVFEAGAYLVVDEATGAIVAELDAKPGASLNVRPGTYRVTKRSEGEVRWGRVEVRAGDRHPADEQLEERPSVARLVRKGGARGPSEAHLLRVSAGVRGELTPSVGSVALFRIGYELTLPWLSVVPYVALTTPGGQAGTRLRWRTSELGLGLALAHAFDFRYVTLRGRIFGEAVRLAQTEDLQREPTRRTWGVVTGVGAGLESPPLWGFTFSVAGEVGFYTYRSTDDVVAPASGGETVTRPAFRGLAGVAYGF